MLALSLASFVVLQAGPASAMTPSVATEPGDQFHPLTPVRVLDTRLGLGAPKAPLLSRRPITVALTRQGGVPDGGVVAVVLNVTVTDAKSPGVLTVFPGSQTVPLASNLNFVAGQTVANLVVVRLDTHGNIQIVSTATSADVVADVAGWYSERATATKGFGLLRPLPPARLLDTRVSGGTLGSGGSLNLQVGGRGGVPASGVGAVVLNITATAGSSNTYVRVYPTGEPVPVISNLNVAAHRTVANRVIVPLGAGGRITLTNFSGRQPLVVDVNGYYTDESNAAAPGGYIYVLRPVRIVDTRTGLGGQAAPVAANHYLTVKVTHIAGLPGSTPGHPTVAVVVNVTITRPSGTTYLTAYPSNQSVPGTSDLNATAGQTVPNLVIVGVGPDGTFRIRNNSGYAHVVVDVLGVVREDTT